MGGWDLSTHGFRDCTLYILEALYPIVPCFKQNPEARNFDSSPHQL